MVEYSPFDHSVVERCYPVYRELRDEAPVYYCTDLDFYALSRYDEVLRAHLDPATFSSGMGTSIELTGPDQPFLITKDPPQHTWHRRLVSRVFTPRRISGLEPMIWATAARYLDQEIGGDGSDVVTDFSFRLPLDVMGALLDIPPDYREEVHVKSDLLAARDGREIRPDSAMQASADLVVCSCTHRRAT
jgi:cytochrome P450